MKQFYRVLLSEIYKIKKTNYIVLAILLPVIVTTFVLLFFIFKNEQFSNNGLNNWLNFGRYSLSFYYFIYSFFIIFLAISINEIEYKTNGIHTILTLPVPKYFINYSKLLTLFLLMIFSLLIAFILFLSSIKLLISLYPNMHFQDYSYKNNVFVFFIKLLISNTSILTIHFFISKLIKGFVLPASIGTFLFFFGIMSEKWQYSYFIPYSYSYKTYIDYFTNTNIIYSNYINMALIYILFFTILIGTYNFINYGRSK